MDSWLKSSKPHLFVMILFTELHFLLSRRKFSILFRLIWQPTLWNKTAPYISHPFFHFPSKHQQPAIPSSNTYHLRSLTAQSRILDWKFTGWGIVYAQQIVRSVLKLRGRKYSMVYINGFWSFISEVYINEMDIAWRQPKN